MDIIIVCHTEFGFVSDKKEVIPDKNAVSGVRGGVFNLSKLADKYGARISFAVCPETTEYFPKNINHEIGLHLHPDDIFIKKNCQQFLASTVLRDYSYQEQYEFIKTGRDYLENIFGRKQKIFVAGRWSLDNNTIRALSELGFTHDCSAPSNSKKPHYDWSKIPRICLPYHPRLEDYQQRGNLTILIVPISQTLFGGTVSPEGIPLYGFPWLKACFSEYYKLGVPLFHICLHSSSMTDTFYLSIMEKILAFVSQHENINFKFASEIKKYPAKKFKTKILPYVFASNKQLLKTAFKRIFKKS